MNNQIVILILLACGLLRCTTSSSEIVNSNSDDKTTLIVAKPLIPNKYLFYIDTMGYDEDKIVFPHYKEWKYNQHISTRIATDSANKNIGAITYEHLLYKQSTKQAIINYNDKRHSFTRNKGIIERDNRMVNDMVFNATLSKRTDSLLQAKITVFWEKYQIEASALLLRIDDINFYSAYKEAIVAEAKVIPKQK